MDIAPQSDLCCRAHTRAGRSHHTVYIQRVTQTAALGKAQELRTLNIAQVKARQDQGIRASLSAPLTGVGGRLVVGLMYDALADLQALRERNASDAAFQQYAAKIATLMANPIETEIWEMLLQVQTGSTPAYTQAITFTAGIGHTAALRAAVLERGTTRQAAGVRCGVLEQVATDAYRIRFTLPLGALSELEARRVQNRNDPELQAFQSRVTPLLGAPNRVEISEVIVPFQPRGN
jgi:hypothetical protein